MEELEGIQPYMVGACNRKPGSIFSAARFHCFHFLIMSCRERSRQAKSPDSTQCSDSRKEKRETIGRKKKEDPLKPNHAKEKPPVKETTKEKGKHLTREHSREQQTPPEKTKTQIHSSRSTSVKKPPLHRDLESQATTMRSETAKASLKTTKPKAGGKEETLTRCTKAAGKMEGAQLEEKKIDRPSGGKKETAAEKSCDTEHADKIKPKMLKTRSVSEDSVLQSTLEKLKIRAKDKSDTSKVVNDFIENLIRHLKKETICFQDVDKPLRTGSYYENLKILDPDEFDVMLPMPVERVQVEPFRENGAFYSVALKRGNSHLMKFQQNDVLSASEMLQEFRNEVKKFAKGFPAWTIEKKKGGCPAVTLTHKVGSVTISLDVVLCLKVTSSWPSFTSDGLKIDQWLGTKVKREYKWKPYYLVPKYEGRGNVENDGVLNKDAWRISFSHIEKDIIKKHGSEKTCCERGGASCCRKHCLKLLKHLLHLLKENDPSFAKFCSYHAKTTLLHACCSRTRDSDWGASDLSRCFGLLLQDFESHLRRGELYNFFIPSQNLLSGLGKTRCKHLADCVKEQRESGFPIFDTYLQNPC
ncbi:cyclic GMP-AMP synthase isoform X1 [Poecilia latipinna]|uniref:cyclic GMP-AMP synthase isoform X1 n=1 Tax=Poecilia latipinna TaxID=48699 RepID=UPI00072E16A9|nr:PREDICTED: cyclic GMP-AMP synthase isoform X1 [Poecilia latipinna]